MTEQKHPRFVAFLTGLAPKGGADGSGDRAAIATLRRGLGKAPGQAIVAMASLVERHVPLEASGRERDDYYLVAALFASHPTHRQGVSLATAFRRACQASASESLERRFQAVLTAEREDLPTHLRHLIALIASKDEALDWGQLLSDLRYWSHPNRTVQVAWSRDFWGPVATPSTGEGGAAPLPEPAQ